MSALVEVRCAQCGDRIGAVHENIVHLVMLYCDTCVAGRPEPATPAHPYGVSATPIGSPVADARTAVALSRAADRFTAEHFAAASVPTSGEEAARAWDAYFDALAELADGLGELP